MTTLIARIVSQHVRRLLALVLGGLLFLPTIAFAQSTWLDPARPQGVSVELLKPDFNRLSDNTFFSGAYIVSGRVAATPALKIMADLPIVHYGVDGEGLGVSETSVGNPYFGAELAHPNGMLHGELGIRIPLDGNESALMSGMASDLDRREAFFGNLLSIIGNVDYQYQVPSPALSGLTVRLRGGPNLWVYTDDMADDDVDLYANYAAQLWYEVQRIQVGVGAIGRALLTEGDLDFGERTAHQLEVSVLGTYRRVQPGVHFGLPFDDNDFNDVVDYVIGVSLSAHIP